MKTAIFSLILTLFSASSYSTDFILYNCAEETGRVQGIYYRYNLHNRLRHYTAEAFNPTALESIEMVYAYPLTTILSDSTDYEVNSLKERISGLGIEEWKLAMQFYAGDTKEFVLSKVGVGCLDKSNMEELYILTTTPSSNDLCADHSSSPCGVRFVSWFPGSHITVVTETLE